jgi:predicted dehydrogenase
MRDPSVGVAFIGAGAVSQWHAAAVDACVAAHLVGLYDVHLAEGQLAAQTYNCQCYETLEDLLADTAIDVVVVLSPLEQHYNHAQQILQAGKHAIVEKPVANTLAELEALIQAAAASGKHCIPAHNYIYAPGVRRIRSLIADGSFGQVTGAWILYNLYHPPEVAARYPGVLRQIMTHHFYSVLYLFGKPRRLTAMASETRTGKHILDREDQVAVILEMADGALINLFASFAADDQTCDPWTVLYKVLGSGGGGMYSWRDSVVLQSAAGLSWRYPAYEDSFIQEIDTIVTQCILGGEQPLSTLEDAVVAQQLIEAAEEALETGRVIDL